jgi:hypothetical protein
MASSTLDEAFDNARTSMPANYLFTSFVQDGDGWVVSAARRTFAGDWTNSISARGGTLTKALNRLADKLEQHAKTA